MTVHPSELAATLQRRALAQRRREEARAASICAALKARCEQLADEGRIGRAWLIGSLAWGGFGEGSDVDLVIAGSDSRDAALLAAELSGALHVEVQVLRLEELPGDFKQRVLSDGVMLAEALESGGS